MKKKHISIESDGTNLGTKVLFDGNQIDGIISIDIDSINNDEPLLCATIKCYIGQLELKQAEKWLTTKA